MKLVDSGSKRAFTLVELLVVIAIIAVLAAILFPVLAMAREKGRQAVCVSNFKQINLGLLQYVQDYDESMVPANTNGYAISCMGCGRPDYIWPELVQPYFNNWQVFRCPSDVHATDAELGVGAYSNKAIAPDDPDYHYAWGRASGHSAQLRVFKSLGLRSRPGVLGFAARAEFRHWFSCQYHDVY